MRQPGKGTLRRWEREQARQGFLAQLFMSTPARTQKSRQMRRALERIFMKDARSEKRQNELRNRRRR